MINFKKILLVEDDNISVLIVTRIMEINQFAEKILIAENGLIACNILQKSIDEKEPLPEIILLDLRMGVMDGWEFLNWYQEFTKQMETPPPVYILSSTIDETDSRQAAAYKHVKGFISKPITTEHLLKILKDHRI